MTDHPALPDPHIPPDGFAVLVGYRLVDWRPDAATVTLAFGRKHLNRSGVVHGGVLTTLIDAACGYAGCWAPPDAPLRRAFTLSLTTHFIATPRGSTLTCIARNRGGGARIYFAAAEVTDDEGRLVASGEGTFRYRSNGSGDSTA